MTDCRPLHEGPPVDQPALDGAELVELELPARPEVVAIARLVVVALADDDPAFDAERAGDIRLAVSEACTNAIEAHLARGDGAPVLLRCWRSPAELRVAVRDCGGGFDLDAAVRPADLTEPSRLDYEGGLGIPLIRLLTDRVEFRRHDDGTEVVMTFGPANATGRIGP